MREEEEEDPERGIENSIEIGRTRIRNLQKGKVSGEWNQGNKEKGVIVLGFYKW